MELDFVRGHMGGNLIILVLGEQMPPEKELETAVKLLKPEYLYGHEVGILYHREGDSGLKVKIAEPTSQCFISACGGFTQVLGAALIETDLGDIFGIDRHAARTEVLLDTDCGPTKLYIESAEGRAKRIKTDMTAFVRECYRRGIKPLHYEGLEVMQAGKFLVLEADRCKSIFPWADFINWDRRTREMLTTIQDQFAGETGEMEYNAALYDRNPQYGGDMRVIYPHCVKADYFEPSCGTGTVALGIAALAWGELPKVSANGPETISLKIECGGGRELGGPDITELEMIVEKGRVKEAAFSHSNVEITAAGKAWL